MPVTRLPAVIPEAHLSSKESHSLTGDKKIVIMTSQSRSVWDMSSIGMTAGRWGERGGCRWIACPQEIFFFFAFLSAAIIQRDTLLNLPPLSLKSILILSLHIHNVPSTYVYTCQVILLPFQIRLCIWVVYVFSLSVGSRRSLLLSVCYCHRRLCYLSFPDLSITSCWMDTHKP